MPDMQSIKGRTELTAAYLPHDGRVFYTGSPKRKSAQEIVELLKSVRALHPNTKLYLILDNHKMHISKDFKRFAYEEDKNIELAYTPKHAFWLNAVEQIFASIQEWVLDNCFYQPLEKAIAMIERHLSSPGRSLVELLIMRPF
jgi:transposase